MYPRVGMIGGTGPYAWGRGESVDSETPYRTVTVTCHDDARGSGGTKARQTCACAATPPQAALRPGVAA